MVIRQGADKMKNLSRIFYIYSEASLAVLFIIGAILEMLCFAYFAYIGADFLQLVTAIAASGFALAAAFNVRYILKRGGK
jgi:hypothetical protein